MQRISYHVIRSDRRTIALQVLPDGKVVVRCPISMRDAQIHTFVADKEKWIRKRLQNLSTPEPKLSSDALQKLKRQAEQVLRQRLTHFAPLVGVSYGRVTVRHQKTRWGSCSSKGNLNFNCLLLLAPSEVLDYVVVHELCHRKELNHSDRFWAAVGQILPDYAVRRKWLRENGARLIGRLP